MYFFKSLKYETPLVFSILGGFTCALLHGADRVQGRVKCWGRNDRGQLGLASGDDDDIGDDERDMGDNLPALELGAAAVQISAGMSHACAVLEGGVAKCWGDNRQGQLGQGDKADRGEEKGTMGSHLKAIDFG